MTSPPPVRGTGPLLAAGVHADVHEWVDGAQEPRVVKIHRGAGRRRSALSEAAVLAALDHPHVVPLLDVAETPTGLGLVLPRLDPRSAEALVRERRVITAGEAVTLVVPLLRAVVHLQRRRFPPGVSLATSLSWGNVLFDERGAPVLTALRPAAEQGPGRMVDPESVDDAARRLVRQILDVTVGGDEASRILVTRLATEGGSPDELIEATFGLEEAVPVERPEAGSIVTGADVPGVPHVPASVALDDAVTEPLAARARAVLGQVRPRVWLTSGVVVASTAIAAVALDGRPGRLGGGPSSESTSTAAGPEEGRETSGVGRPLLSGRPSPPVSLPATGPKNGHEVVAATRLLLAHREECLRDLDAECLTQVDRAGSPLARDDAAAVADPALIASRPVAVDLGDQTNAFRDTVLFDATTRSVGPDGGDGEPASVLVERTEAGWRLSDVR